MFYNHTVKLAEMLGKRKNFTVSMYKAVSIQGHGKVPKNCERFGKEIENLMTGKKILMRKSKENGN